MEFAGQRVPEGPHLRSTSKPTGTEWRSLTQYDHARTDSSELNLTTGLSSSKAQRHAGLQLVGGTGDEEHANLRHQAHCREGGDGGMATVWVAGIEVLQVALPDVSRFISAKMRNCPTDVKRFDDLRVWRWQ